tara:strand:+ start:328 stop:612 length:285 start_codon:yes stop_codon:yes gene_type:complete
MTATTYCMNNGTDTWIFTVKGDAATVEKVNCGGVIVKEKDITTVEQAREFWALGFKLCPHLMRQGTVMPATCTIRPEYAYVQDEADEPMPFGVA